MKWIDLMIVWCWIILFENFWWFWISCTTNQFDLHATLKAFIQSTPCTNMTICSIDLTCFIRMTSKWFLKTTKLRKENGFFRLNLLTKPTWAFRLKNILQAWHEIIPKYLYNAGSPQIRQSDGLVRAFVNITNRYTKCRSHGPFFFFFWTISLKRKRCFIYSPFPFVL